jgi:hypothetical protein
MVQQITLIFKYEESKAMKFRFGIELGDYKTFYMIVNKFFTNPLEKPDFDEIFRVHPELKEDNMDYSIMDPNVNLGFVFNKQMHIENINEVGTNEYEIEWDVIY